MSMVTSGALAALFMGICMGATSKPSQSAAVHVPQAPRLAVDSSSTGLLASAELLRRSAG